MISGTSSPQSFRGASGESVSQSLDNSGVDNVNNAIQGSSVNLNSSNYNIGASN
jgi:hypothetical protein